LAPWCSAATISARCAAPSGSRPASASGSIGRPVRLPSSASADAVAASSTSGPRRGSTPSTAFSTTLSVPALAPCCCTMPMPAARAARRSQLATSTRAPATSSVPASPRTTPARILTRVDLPAPFSPTSACTVPRRTASRAPVSTTHAP
jgi:hypothetical protein